MELFLREGFWSLEMRKFENMEMRIAIRLSLFDCTWMSKWVIEGSEGL
jgi:hypothetical protein